MVFKGELTRHILKCYTNGKAQDKKPVPNELSMLIFYLQSRPGKIPKASMLLSTRATAFSAKDNGGNLGVTALIMHELILQLHDQLSLFADGALSIIETVIDNCKSDQYFLELAQMLFSDFNRYHNGVLFAGNPAYSQKFLNVTQKFVEVCQHGSPSSRIIAINAVTSLSASPALATKIGQKALITGVYGLEANLPHSPQVYEEVTKIDISTPPPTGENDLEFRSVMGLRQTLNTPSLELVSGIVRNLLRWLSGSSGEWQMQLITHLAKWVPPQNRFVVTKTVVSEMSSLPIDNVKQILAFSKYLDALLTAEESKIGLSVVDVLRQLLRLQHKLIDSPPQSVDHQTIQTALIQLRQNIGNLVNTNIYPGQTNDMIKEILQSYSATGPAPVAISPKVSLNGGDQSPGSSRATTSTIARRSGIVINDFRVLLELLQNKYVHDQRKLSPSLWLNTQWILTAQNPQLVVLYAQTFDSFMQSAQFSAHPSSKKGSNLFRQFCDLGQKDLPAMSYVAIYYCLLSLLKLQSWACQFLIPWLLAILPSDYKDSEPNERVNVCRSTLGLAGLLAATKQLEMQDCSEELFNLINHRVEEKLWLPGVTYPPAVSLEEAITSVCDIDPLQFDIADTDSVTENDIFVTRRSATELLHLQDSKYLSPEEATFVVSPPFSIDAPGEDDEARTSKATRIPSERGANGSRSVSGQSNVSLATITQAPKIGDLLKRQADAQSSNSNEWPAPPNKSENRISLPPKRSSSATIRPGDIDLISIIEKVSVNGNSQIRGNLTT